MTHPDTDSPVLRVAQVGLGWVALHRHLPAMRAHGGFEVFGVIDRQPERAARVGRDQRIPRSHCGDDLRHVPWLDDVDVVVIATSPFSHVDLAAAALERGKHVLVEKPLAMTVADGEALVSLAHQCGRVLGIVHNFQFARSTRMLLRDLNAGKLGAPRALIASQLGNPARRLPAWYEELPLGLFYDESPHLLYLLRCLSPAPLRLLSCTMFPSSVGHVTPASIHAQYETGEGTMRRPVTLTMHFESPVSEWHVTVLGDHALGDVDVFRDIYLRLPNDGRHDTWPVLRTSLVATAQHWGQHFQRGPLHLAGKLLYGNDEVFARFHQAVSTGGQLQGVSGEDGLHVLRMQHEIIGNAHRL
ncbi:MAG: Gfo/Idh/MocA family oxidoreductase [Vicinamibacterales bacterium]